MNAFIWVTGKKKQRMITFLIDTQEEMQGRSSNNQVL